MSALDYVLRGAPSAVRRAEAAYRVAVASRDLDGLPAVEMALLRACADAGSASLVYPLTQRIRDELGLDRRPRMDPDGVGQPSIHPEGATRRVTLTLPGALLDAVGAEPSTSVAVAEAIRDGLLLRAMTSE